MRKAQRGPIHFELGLLRCCLHTEKMNYGRNLMSARIILSVCLGMCIFCAVKTGKKQNLMVEQVWQVRPRSSTYMNEVKSITDSKAPGGFC